MKLPSPPERSFASDNAAGAHPAVLAAIAEANTGHALAYGADRWTGECAGRFAELFGRGETLLTFTGTGANIVGLMAMLRPVDAVVCAAGAHINVDEAGAAERIVGAKLIDLPAPDGKLVPEQLAEVAPLLGNEHHVQPAAVSITQPTELGTLYTAEEVAALCDRAHAMGMRVHMDGARIANAVAALSPSRQLAVSTLRSLTVDAGVDVLSFGGTKNGVLGAEAVIFLDTDLADRASYLRKSVTQLASKMRFLAAQFLALLDDDLWFDNAAVANAMAASLHDLVADVPGLDVAVPAVNSLFPTLARPAAAALQQWSFFWEWDPLPGTDRCQVRWMTSWDTTAADVDRFAAGVTSATLASPAGSLT